MGNVTADGKWLWLSGRFDDVVYAFDTATGKVSVYNPLVIDKGTQPGAAPVVPQLTATSVVGLWFGFNGNNLTSKGIAIQAQALLTSHFTVSASYGYDQAKFSASSYGEGGAILINKGDGIDGAPPQTASLAMQYDIPSVFGHSAFLRADGQYTSKENMTAATDPQTTAYLPGNFVRPQTLIGNLRAGMNFDRLQVSLFCTNFTNSHPLYQAANGLLGGIYNGPDMLITMRPREIGGTVVYKY